jgi:hypothetical protein
LDFIDYTGRNAEAVIEWLGPNYAGTVGTAILWRCIHDMPCDHCPGTLSPRQGLARMESGTVRAASVPNG